MKKLSIGLIGCGRVAPTHLNALLKLKNKFDLKGLYGTNLKNCSKLAKEFKTIAFEKEEDFFSYPFDVIAVCTPNGLHVEHGKKALKNNSHVVMEKPLALSKEDAIDIVSYAKNKNKGLFLVHQNRFNPAVKFVKEEIIAGNLGKIYTINSNILWAHGQDYFDKSSWHGCEKKDGGVLYTQASHFLDLMQWFMDSPVKTVFSKRNTIARNIKTEDTAIAILEWKNGSVGILFVSLLAQNHTEGSITIIAEKALIKIGGIALNKIELWDSKNPPSNKKLEEINTLPKTRYGEGHIGFYESVYDAILAKKSVVLSEEEAIYNTEILDKLLESSKLNKTVII